MNGWTLTNVFEINGRLTVADTVEEAISIYRRWVPGIKIRKISQVYGGNNDYKALMAEPVAYSCQGWKLTHITFTGVDEWTDIERLVSIQQRYPKAEFGVLLSKNWQDNGNRYPSPQFIEKLRGRGLRLSGHLCGSLARDVLGMGGFHNIKKPISALLDIFQRVQLNVSGYTEYDSTEIIPGPLQEVIIQQGDDRRLFEQCYINNGEFIAILLDKSGGLGVDTPIVIPPYAFRIHAGFAGGITPDNVIDKMAAITSSSSVGKFWIDMESGVRTDDHFDLDKVEDVCKIVYDNFLTEKG